MILYISLTNKPPVSMALICTERGGGNSYTRFTTLAFNHTVMQ